MSSQTAIRKKQTRKRSKRSKGVKPMISQVIEKMERETGIEPATNSLEGCDSTTELLPLLESTVWRSRPNNSFNIEYTSATFRLASMPALSTPASALC